MHSADQRDGRSHSAATEQADALRPIAPPAPGSRTPRRRLPGAPGPLGGGTGPVTADRPEPPGRIPAAQSLGAGPQLVAHAPQTPPRPVRDGSGRPGVNRIARPPGSSGRFPGAGMILILPWIQTLHHTQDDPGLGRTHPLTPTRRLKHHVHADNPRSRR